MAGIAVQEFRDGAATGAAQLARRVRIVESFGVKITPALVESMTLALVEMWGGVVYPQDQEVQPSGETRERDA